MNEAPQYCLAAALPAFFLRLAAGWLPGHWKRLRFLVLLYPAALLVLAALVWKRIKGRDKDDVLL